MKRRIRLWRETLKIDAPRFSAARAPPAQWWRANITNDDENLVIAIVAPILSHAPILPSIDCRFRPTRSGMTNYNRCCILAGSQRTPIDVISRARLVMTARSTAPLIDSAGGIAPSSKRPRSRLAAQIIKGLS